MSEVVEGGVKEIRHPRVIEYAQSFVRYVDRRVDMLSELAALPEAQAFAPEVRELVARLERARAEIAPTRAVTAR